MPQSAATSLAISAPHSDAERERLSEGFADVRARSLALAAPLSPEDMTAQSMPDASPTKWHLAHTTWFFETFLLRDHAAGYRPFDPAYGYLFNSYYEAEGARHARPNRGLVTRPSVDEVCDYRHHVDAAVTALIEDAPEAVWTEFAPLLELGLHHEMQHQELLMTDILHLLAQNSLDPAYRDVALPSAGETSPLGWWEHGGGIVEIGHDTDDPAAGFAFDCEGPRHQVLLQPFALADRLVTNDEWLAFMADGGYGDPALWLSDGWATVQREGWRAPLYWAEAEDGGWRAMSLLGRHPVDPAAPVCHVSLYEADAFARWAGHRLPKEAELEVASAALPVAGNLLGRDTLAPQAAGEGQGGLPRQLWGDVWEWTQSAYGPYPGFRAAAGAVGEYNGKFMCSQAVLRGGSCVTPDAQLRPSYRNFFYPPQRWQFTGLRLARDL